MDFLFKNLNKRPQSISLLPNLHCKAWFILGAKRIWLHSSVFAANLAKLFVTATCIAIAAMVVMAMVVMDMATDDYGYSNNAEDENLWVNTIIKCSHCQNQNSIRSWPNFSKYPKYLASSMVSWQYICTAGLILHGGN